MSVQPRRRNAHVLRQETGGLIAWGTYDTGKPRVRLLLEALRARRALAEQIHVNVWRDIEDKAVAGRWRMVRALLRQLIAYPPALIRSAMRPRGQVILLFYPAIIDIFALWPVARLRRQTIVFDAFISFYDTIVCDRGQLNPRGLLARVLWHLERWALELADLIIVDTDEHGRHFSTTFGIPRSKFVTVAVGAEPLFWDSPANPTPKQFPAQLPGYVLFYGQLIPLHGIETILAASALTEARSIHWLVVGTGQEEPVLRAALQESGHANVTWIPWVDYEALPALIDGSALCLGIFGTSDKAGRVIPNKVFQALARGKRVITRSSPAMDPLAKRFPRAIVTVPANDPAALADAVLRGLSRADASRGLPLEARTELGPEKGVDELLRRLASGARP